MSIDTSDTAATVQPVSADAAVTVARWFDGEPTELAEFEVGGQDAGNETGGYVLLTAGELRELAATLTAVGDQIEA